MVTKTDFLDAIWHAPDALWNLIAPILGTNKTTRHRRLFGTSAAMRKSALPGNGKPWMR